MYVLNCMHPVQVVVKNWMPHETSLDGINILAHLVSDAGQAYIPFFRLYMNITFVQNACCDS